MAQQQNTPTQESAEAQAETDDAEIASEDANVTVTGSTEITTTTSLSPTNSVTGATSVTRTTSITRTAPLSAAVGVTPTTTLTVTLPTPTPESERPVEAPDAEDPSLPADGEAGDLTSTTDLAPEEVSTDDVGVLDGTILANRSDAAIRFFVEGQLFTLEPRRSIGLDLPRVSAVLNLYNCEADTPESQPGCYWDPYLLQRDGFYEIVTGAEAGEAVSLTLREAGAPELNEIWIQNRTGKVETIVYRGDTFQLTPASVQEFTVDADDMPTFFLRSCVETADDSVCEWLPVVAETGVYYGLTLMETAGGRPNTTLSALELTPVLTGSSGEPVIETPPQLLCTLLVPALNVRSGPGLEYEIVAKIRGTEAEPANVLVVGRNELADWLAVDARVADGGWITSSTSYISCNGDVGELPLTEVTDGRLAPTPEPVAQTSVESAGDAVAQSDQAEGEETAAVQETSPQLSEPPDGLALLIINNAFDHEIRFTLDQKYRPEIGPSEIDLQPGESTSVVIYPDFIPFSVSSAWNSLSGNADFYMEADQTRTLWLIFVPDPDGSGRWILQY